MQPITKLDKLDDLLDAAVVGFACAFIDFSAEDRKHLSANWIHDLPARMTDMKTKLLSTDDGKALYADWTQHFKDSRNYKVDLDNNYVLLQTFPKCSAVSIEKASRCATTLWTRALISVGVAVRKGTG